MSFGNPLAFVLLLLLIPMIWMYLRPRHQHFVKLPSAVNIKAIRGFKAIPMPPRLPRGTACRNGVYINRTIALLYGRRFG